VSNIPDKEKNRQTKSHNMIRRMIKNTKVCHRLVVLFHLCLVLRCHAGPVSDGTVISQLRITHHAAQVLTTKLKLKLMLKSLPSHKGPYDLRFNSPQPDTSQAASPWTSVSLGVPV